MEFIGEGIVEQMVPFLTEWKSVHSTRTLRRDSPDLILENLTDEDADFLKNHTEYQFYLKKYGYEQNLHDD